MCGIQLGQKTQPINRNINQIKTRIRINGTNNDVTNILPSKYVDLLKLRFIFTKKFQKTYFSVLSQNKSFYIISFLQSFLIFQNKSLLETVKISPSKEQFCQFCRVQFTGDGRQA